MWRQWPTRQASTSSVLFVTQDSVIRDQHNNNKHCADRCNDVSTLERLLWQSRRFLISAGGIVHNSGSSTTWNLSQPKWFCSSLKCLDLDCSKVRSVSASSMSRSRHPTRLLDVIETNASGRVTRQSHSLTSALTVYRPVPLLGPSFSPAGFPTVCSAAGLSYAVHWSQHLSLIQLEHWLLQRAVTRDQPQSRTAAFRHSTDRGCHWNCSPTSVSSHCRQPRQICKETLILAWSRWQYRSLHAIWQYLSHSCHWRYAKHPTNTREGKGGGGGRREKWIHNYENSTP